MTAAIPSKKSLMVFPIVGIVSSAGGLDAYKRFFSVMPSDAGIAFVLVPHLDPTHKSMMVELLSRLTAMPVFEAKHGMSIQVNSIYIIPPNHFLEVSGGKLKLSDLPTCGEFKTSIDFFLESLADDQGELAIGIVLSGTGSHGALGVREIKLNGGMAVAQDPTSAQHDQMPRNAIDTGVIDCILQPEKMPEAISRYAQTVCSKTAATFSVESKHSSDSVDQILSLLKLYTAYDFHSYRKPMILRRIQRRMGVLKVDSITSYLNILKRQPDEVKALCKALLISVTSFFRDPEAYQILERSLISAILAQAPQNMPVRVWVPGCATGEEAYSIAILLLDQLSEYKSIPAIQIFASDIDDDALAIARAGVYPASVVGGVPPDRLAKFFSMIDEDHYQIKPHIRESIVFSRQNVISDSPFSKLNFIACRNLLIYLEPEMQQKVISLFHFALVTGGYLFLGPAESLGQASDLFDTVSRKWRIYRRRNAANRHRISIPLNRMEDRDKLSLISPPNALLQKSLKELTERTILNDYSPAAALISRKLEILYVTGPLANYLEFPKGALSRDILNMARTGLRGKLRNAINIAIRDTRAVIDSEARVLRDGNYLHCTISVRPLSDSRNGDELFLVVFQDRSSNVASVMKDTGALTTSESSSKSSSSNKLSDPRIDHLALIKELEFELKSSTEELHSTIEEMESSSEELKVSNEELMSVNEELQSANEELETSKEELQSLNDELNTLNIQLEDKVSELGNATNNLINLMSSTEIATIFLDENLNINFYTPPAQLLMNLRETDIGRPIADITPRFKDSKMLSECREVLTTPNTVDREITTEESRYYLRRILPYRTSAQEVAGVVITFIDLTQRRNAEKVQRDESDRHFSELYETTERMKAILNTAVDAIVTFDSTGTLDTVNDATERLFLHSRTDLIGKNFSLLLPSVFSRYAHPIANDSMQDELSRLVGRRVEVLARRKDGTTFPVDLAISRIDHLDLYNAILRDISDRKLLQAQIHEIASTEQMRIGQELHDGTQQELTGLSLYSGAITDFLNNSKQDSHSGSEDWIITADEFQRLRTTAEKLTQGLREANRRVQQLSHGIMPVQIDADGLKSALTELATRTNGLSNIECRFVSDIETSVPDNSIATQLYRIAQESLNNALKHGEVSKISILLYQIEGEIILEVSDNGIGFDSENQKATSDSPGMGLQIMHYRASIIGAVLKIDSTRDHGTTVRCSVPKPECLR